MNGIDYKIGVIVDATMRVHGVDNSGFIGSK